MKKETWRRGLKWDIVVSTIEGSRREQLWGRRGGREEIRDPDLFRSEEISEAPFYKYNPLPLLHPYRYRRWICSQYVAAGSSSSLRPLSLRVLTDADNKREIRTSMCARWWEVWRVLVDDALHYFRRFSVTAASCIERNMGQLVHQNVPLLRQTATPQRVLCLGRRLLFSKYEGGLKSFRPNNDTRHFFLIFYLFFYIVSLLLYTLLPAMLPSL